MAERRFGREAARYAWRFDGTLQTRWDPLNRATNYCNFRRGTPQRIDHPDGTTELAVVDHRGAVTSYTNEAGITTQYAYDPLGRLTSVVYPGGDGVN